MLSWTKLAGLASRIRRPKVAALRSLKRVNRGNISVITVQYIRNIAELEADSPKNRIDKAAHSLIVG
jgi:hypothetical protein